MAQPPSYERQKNFADDFGNETDHSALNAELDRASNSINDIRTNLALVQADDGKIRASSITTDSLDQEVLDYVQEKALAGANAVADAATAIAREAQQHAASAVQTAFDAVDVASSHWVASWLSFPDESSKSCCTIGAYSTPMSAMCLM